VLRVLVPLVVVAVVVVPLVYLMLVVLVTRHRNAKVCSPALRKPDVADDWRAWELYYTELATQARGTDSAAMYENLAASYRALQADGRYIYTRPDDD